MRSERATLRKSNEIMQYLNVYVYYTPSAFYASSLIIVLAKINLLYYIDRSVLLENTPRIKFIRNYIRDPSGVFSISSLVRILMTSFPTSGLKI